MAEEKTGVYRAFDLHAQPDGPGPALAAIRPVNADPNVLARGSALAEQAIDSGTDDPDGDEDAAAPLVAESEQAFENQEEKTGLSLTLGLNAQPDRALAAIRPVDADPEVVPISSPPALPATDSGTVDPDLDEDAAAAASDRSYDPIALERALVAQAEQALENKEYPRAARCFARAVEFAPSRVDYLVMSGHCLKDAGDFSGAFVAYSAALAALPSGDTHVQLGHLFKITGNLYEAEASYRQGARTRGSLGADRTCKPGLGLRGGVDLLPRLGAA